MGLGAGGGGGVDGAATSQGTDRAHSGIWTVMHEVSESPTRAIG